MAIQLIQALSIDRLHGGTTDSQIAGTLGAGALEVLGFNPAAVLSISVFFPDVRHHE
jgi:hypothetical protein